MNGADRAGANRRAPFGRPVLAVVAFTVGGNSVSFGFAADRKEAD
jgi:hypothetical protein